MRVFLSKKTIYGFNMGLYVLKFFSKKKIISLHYIQLFLQLSFINLDRTSIVNRNVELCIWWLNVFMSLVSTKNHIATTNRLYLWKKNVLISLGWERLFWKNMESFHQWWREAKANKPYKKHSKFLKGWKAKRSAKLKI